MIRFLGRWIARAALALVGLLIVLLIPVGWVETMCRPSAATATYVPLITDPGQQRPESRTLMTYPEWHIVHAYEDYATVIATGDPHQFSYLKSIWGFWDSLCTLSRETGSHGGFDLPTKQMVYTIGVSFTVELGLKAAYEESIGRVFAVMRGSRHSALDDLSALQAAGYAAFLQQTPWYRWDFRTDAEALAAAATPALRDRERAIALGIEFRAKAAYAGVIAAAVAGVGADELTIRSIVAGLSKAKLQAIDGVTILSETPAGTLIETPRYRAFTLILQAIAAKGGQIVEIAGNDDIMFTALSAEPWEEGEIFQMQRQGQEDYRHLLLVKVTALAETLNALPGRGMVLEQIHDY